jgi:hypothetical protein
MNRGVRAAFGHMRSCRPAVIRFDVPGVGGSPLPARPYRLTGLCQLIAGLPT